MKDYILYLDTPAKEWENCSPLGNGRMGAAIFGSFTQEKIYINEETVWASSDAPKPDGHFRDKLDHIRSMFIDGKGNEADEWAKNNLGEFATVKSYETAGIFTVDYAANGRITDYSRRLDLVNGVCTVEAKCNCGGIRSQAFVSKPDDIIVYRISADNPFSFTLGYKREHTLSLEAQGNILKAVCETGCGSHRFCTAAKIDTDGICEAKGGCIAVSNCKTAVIYIGIATEYSCDGYIDSCLAHIGSLRDYDSILSDHKADFSSVMKRSDIVLKGDEELEALPVRSRLKRLKKDENCKDFGLISLYYQFGRYLLVSSSRPGSLPANLQGVWAEKMCNPWNADYHTNINLQMNYWLAETANLADCHEPLFDYMNNYLLDSGIKTAREYYRVEGTVVHHLSDIYGFTAPADGLWGLWPMGGAWLAYHMWEHYLFSGDKDFLKKTAYRYIKYSALFFINYMFEHNGVMLSGPSTSPENRYLLNGSETFLAISPTMDIEIITGLLKSYIEAERILGIDSETAGRAELTLSKLPPLKVGRHGQLMEWIGDYKEVEPGHRHISHAYALYPGCEITSQTPQLYSAIRITLERRLANGGGHTGWSRAWLINLYARLHDGSNAYDNLIMLFSRSTADNLFDIHPPFQIDGNFGGAAGIAEMLLQSHDGRITLLPAVVPGFTGSFSGIRARGGITVDAEFENCFVKSFSFTALQDCTVKLALPEHQRYSLIYMENSAEPLQCNDGLYNAELQGGKQINFTVRD